MCDFLNSFHVRRVVRSIKVPPLNVASHEHVQLNSIKVKANTLIYKKYIYIYNTCISLIHLRSQPHMLKTDLPISNLLKEVLGPRTKEH